MLFFKRENDFQRTQHWRGEGEGGGGRGRARESK